MILEAQDLHYEFPGGVSALNGLTLNIPRGARLGILGANGAGKSTLLLHLNGTLRPRAGRVLIDGEPVDYSRAGLTALRRRVGLVLQDPDDQLFAASVFEDVSFGPLHLGCTEEDARARVEEALQALRITELAARPTHMLSGGERKRAAIAGAVAMRPEVLLLDEPTAGLDHHAEVHLVRLLRKLGEAGSTLVFTTHSAELSLELASHVALFVGGRVIASGEATSILADKKLMAAAKLRPPLILELAMKARDLGLVTADEPLPRTSRDILSLLDRWQTRSPNDIR